jgi:uncharacterized spore protein YtfJ
MTDTMTTAPASVLDEVRGHRDSLTVGRVFGDAYEVDGMTVIPVARVAGGGGGGGGEGSGEHGDGEKGFGTGFGLRARGIGVYQVRDGELTWKPAVDSTQIAKGGQVLAGIIAICATLVLLRRWS